MPEADDVWISLPPAPGALTSRKNLTVCLVTFTLPQKFTSKTERATSSGVPSTSLIGGPHSSHYWTLRPASEKLRKRHHHILLLSDINLKNAQFVARILRQPVVTTWRSCNILLQIMCYSTRRHSRITCSDAKLIWHCDAPVDQVSPVSRRFSIQLELTRYCALGLLSSEGTNIGIHTFRTNVRLQRRCGWDTQTESCIFFRLAAWNVLIAPRSQVDTSSLWLGCIRIEKTVDTASQSLHFKYILTLGFPR